MSTIVSTSLHEHRDVHTVDELHEEDIDNLSGTATAELLEFQLEEHDMHNTGMSTPSSKNRTPKSRPSWRGTAGTAAA